MEIYEELGLTRNEWMAYTALVGSEKLSAAEISLKSKVSYGKIYNVLESLREKGFLRIIPEKSKKFSATDPKFFKELIDNRKKELDKLKEITKELKKNYDSKTQKPVIMDYGIKGFHAINGETKNTEKYEYTITWNSDLNPIWLGNIERRIKKGIDIKTLARFDSETKYNVKEWLKVNRNMRKFENEGIALSVKDDEEVLIALIKSNVTLMIRDKAFAKTMKKLFINTFDKSERID
jgi:HTH-type transcriptional regulator, sugar sensing transcriptional regulator